MKTTNHFALGFRETIPILTGVIPFGAVMGTVSAEAHLTFFQTMFMNFFVFSGAAQLASIELMTKHAASVVVVATGLVINLRFLLYSAAVSPVVQRSPFLVKLLCAHSLTDQSYAVMSSHQEKLKTNSETLQFYFGTAACMFISWQVGVVAGFIFGNVAPASWALDYAVPLSFLALVIPTLKNRKYITIAIFSSVVSILLHPLPYRTGLLGTAVLSVGLAYFLTRKRVDS